MSNKEIYSDKDWQDIAAYLSGEDKERNSVTDSFLNDEGEEIDNYFKMINKQRGEDKIDTDQAWDKLFTKLNDENLVNNKKPVWHSLTRIAAVVVILIATTFTVRFIMTNNNQTQVLAIQTNQFEKNREVLMPDGSTITLNRNSQISFPEKFDDNIRKVELEGEAFFDIVSDPSKPFVIDAGNGEVRVLGTSFNVITDNENHEVEVFVKTGKVLLTDQDGSGEITIEPGYIGKLRDSTPYRSQNTNPNYLSWKTEVLSYEGTGLEQVFEDIKRVHNISIEVENDEILNLLFTSEFRNNSPETIIETICTSFSLTFEKKDEIYYLSK